MTYRIVLNEFISQNYLENLYFNTSKEIKKYNKILIDLSKVQTIDRFSFEYLIKMQKSWQMLGKEVFLCCIPDYIAEIISNWEFDFDIKVIINENF